jgi:hypothetical protein
MWSEKVDLDVHAKFDRTVATFEFKNSGPACTVRMGFPDFGLWAYDYPHKKPETIFKTFQSYVDGKPVATKLELGADEREQWRVKDVWFPEDGTVTVEEEYTTEVGGIADKVVMAAAAYIVHTGASWKGPIGRADFAVHFRPDTELPTPFQVKYVANPKSPSNDLEEHVAKPGGIYVIRRSRTER